MAAQGPQETDIGKYSERLEGAPETKILEWVWQKFGDQAAATSSFQTQSVPLLHLIATHVPELPILFLDTGFHFPETLEFRDQLIEQFGLNVRSLEPRLGHDGFREKQVKLHRRHPNMCCYLNKVEPLITGGCGFIGTNLIRRLLKGNGDVHSIWVHDNLSVGGAATWRRLLLSKKTVPIGRYSRFRRGACRRGLA